MMRLLVHVLRRKLKPRRPVATESVRLLIAGMMTSRSAAAVRDALAQCPGVQSSEVQWPEGLAVIHGSSLRGEALCRAVEKLGCRVMEIVSDCTGQLAG